MANFSYRFSMYNINGETSTQRPHIVQTSRTASIQQRSNQMKPSHS